ncbi:hypothetical protein PSTG_18612 [Puccinia striiformis f. sp. tritici PST-78]|uniref:Uncharacterized protein n=1 Tax=Puccinia striiformis f. sp. tritici PST-78 TaxID=1165861 RepID=A0A0L0UMM0_9BASI|nr:hypothetical protein PSTG_18612 [Puccinia striiformis f. sp. tritici PST-78]
MAQMQSTLMSGSMSSTVAYQSMLQLAQSFQIAMTQATACTSCFAGQGSQFASVASSTFNQFTRFISQMQGAFGGLICTPFGHGMISPNFLPVIQNVIPGIGGSLNLLGL